MDKLEKALEKSRQQRSALVEGQGAARAASAFTPPVSSTVLDEAFLERQRIVAHRTRCPEADVYRQLRTQVLQVMNASGYKALAITSPNYGDGKTTVALNLGISMALDPKQTVLLVDLDLRKPNLHEYAGVKPQVGLTEHIIHNTPINECMVRLPFERVSLLPAGNALDNSSELLSAPKMIALAQELKERYPDRMVIYDMPPVLEQDDPIAFMPQIDAVLVVVRDGYTREADLKRCLQNLSNAHVIGTVLNNTLQ